MDDKHKILWACSSNPGVTNYPSNNPVSLKAFDLISGDETILEGKPLEQAARMGELMAY